MAAATLIGLTKRYGSIVALDQVDLKIEYGEVTGLLGANGAGKTPLLRTLLVLVTPDTGTVAILGLPRRLDGPIHGVAGFVEASRTWPYLTGRRTLELLAILDGGLRADILADGVIGERSTISNRTPLVRHRMAPSPRCRQRPKPLR